jgi:hypothetical protein
MNVCFKIRKIKSPLKGLFNQRFLSVLFAQAATRLFVARHPLRFLVAIMDSLDSVIYVSS